MEVRPRLQSVNVHIILFKPDSSVRINLNLDNFEIVIGSLRQQCFCDKFYIVANSLRGFKNMDDEVTFHFATENLEPDLGTSRYELLPIRLENCSSAPTTDRNTFILNEQHYNVACGNCSAQLCDKVKFDGILPLPENTDSSDWYCHSHEEKCSSSSVVPKLTQILYSQCFVYVSSKLLRCVTQDESTLFCDSCTSWIGTNENGAWKVWFNTVTFTDDNHHSFSSCPLNDCLKTIEAVTKNPLQSTRMILKCLNSQSKEDVILIWILERNLTVYFNDTTETTVSKVLFKSESQGSDLLMQWLKDVNISVIDVSKPMLLKLYEHLRDMHQYIPKDFKLSNGFYVSYLTCSKIN